MYVRIARFEGAGGLDERTWVIRRQLESGTKATGGELPEGLQGVERVVILTDKDGGRMASLVFCETEAGLREADRALAEMTPAGDGGQLSSVEMYEVAIDLPLR